LWVLGIVLGLHGKVFIVGGATGVGSVRSCQKLPPCPIEPVPAGPKTNPSLAKAEPSTDGGSTSGIVYLRRKKPWARAFFSWREEGELCRPQGQCRRRGRSYSRCRSGGSPAARGADHGEAG